MRHTGEGRCPGGQDAKTLDTGFRRYDGHSELDPSESAISEFSVKPNDPA